MYINSYRGPGTPAENQVRGISDKDVGSATLFAMRSLTKLSVLFREWRSAAYIDINLRFPRASCVEISSRNRIYIGRWGKETHQLNNRTQ